MGRVGAEGVAPVTRRAGTEARRVPGGRTLRYEPFGILRPIMWPHYPKSRALALGHATPWK